MSVISYSKWSTWDKCPRMYKYKYIDKIDTGKTHSMTRGTDIHHSVEQFLLGKEEKMHEDIHDYYVGFFSQLRELGAIPEKRFCVTQDWQITDYNNPEALFRGIIDITLPPIDGVVHVFELKTGRVYDDHVVQRTLYGTAEMAAYPEAERVKVTGIYLDLKKNEESDYTRQFFTYLTNTWTKRFLTMREDNVFPTMPGDACGRCPFSKAKGGPCEF